MGISPCLPSPRNSGSLPSHAVPYSQQIMGPLKVEYPGVGKVGDSPTVKKCWGNSGENKRGKERGREKKEEKRREKGKDRR